MGSEGHVEGDITEAEQDTGGPEIADPVDYGPGRIISPEGRLGLLFVEQIFHVDILCLYGHGPHVLEEMGGMGVFFGIAIGVVHPVEDGVGAWVEKGGALRDKGERVEESFPEFIHLEHLV